MKITIEETKKVLTWLSRLFNENSERFEDDSVVKIFYTHIKDLDKDICREQMKKMAMQFDRFPSLKQFAEFMNPEHDNKLNAIGIEMELNKAIQQDLKKDYGFHSLTKAYVKAYGLKFFDLKQNEDLRKKYVNQFKIQQFLDYHRNNKLNVSTETKQIESPKIPENTPLKQFPNSRKDFKERFLRIKKEDV